MKNDQDSAKSLEGPHVSLPHLAKATTVRDDGLDNHPAPLSSDPQELARQLTDNPEVVQQLAVDDIGPPPDGGREAWLCVAGAFFAIFCLFGFNTSFGQLQVYYLAGPLKEYSVSDVGWISSIALFLVSSGGMFSGRYFDAHGARTLLYSGSVLSIASLIGIAFSTKYWHFLLSHASFGLAGTLLYAPATAVPGHWFLKRRGTAVGVVVCGSGLAGVIYPIMIKNLIEQLNFRKAMLIVAGMNAMLMLFACLTMKARLPPRASPPFKSLLGPWSEPRYSCLVIGAAMILMNWASPYFNAPSLAFSNNASSTIKGYSVVILQAGSFFGRILAGFMADKFGVWNVFVAMGLFSSASLFALWTPTTLPDAAIVIGLLLYGFGSGAWMTLVASSCAAISPLHEVGMRIGMIWSCTGPPALAGPVIVGALITAQDGIFTHAAIFCGATWLLGILIAIGPVPMRYLADWAVDRKGKKHDLDLEKSARV